MLQERIWPVAIYCMYVYTVYGYSTVGDPCRQYELYIPIVTFSKDDFLSFRQAKLNPKKEVACD